MTANPEVARTGSLAMGNKAYDVLKAITTIWLPGIGTLYFTLAGIWNLPHPEQVVGTITAVVTFLGLVLGISNKSYKNTIPPYEGSLVVDESDPDKDVYSLEVDIPLEQMKNQNSITLQVRGDDTPLK